MKKQTIVAMEEFYARYPQMAYLRPQIESAVAEITARKIEIFPKPRKIGAFFNRKLS